jgi:hypothetical protein
MEHRPNRPAEPLKSHNIPFGPWFKVGADLFELAKHDNLIVVDYYPKFPEIVLLPNKTSHAVVTACKSIFSRSGILAIIFSDNGPCFSSVILQEFAKSWKFEHQTSSPGFS